MYSRTYAKAALFDGKGRVLLLRRGATDPRRPGDQDFPGGGIEPGEDIGAGLIREIKEETGLDVTIEQLHLIYTATGSHDELSACRLLYYAKLDTPQVVLSWEHDAYQWVDPQEVTELFKHPFYSIGFDYALQHNLCKQ